MKRKIYCGVALLMCAAAISVFAASQRTETSALLRANIEALTNNEDGSDGESGGNLTYRKLTVCLCSQLRPTNGYYNWADMKNHCHDGVGNSCIGMVYACPYTWYCDL